MIDDVDYLIGVVRGRKEGHLVEWRVRATVPARTKSSARLVVTSTPDTSGDCCANADQGDPLVPGVFSP